MKLLVYVSEVVWVRGYHSDLAGYVFQIIAVFVVVVVVVVVVVFLTIQSQ